MVDFTTTQDLQHQVLKKEVDGIEDTTDGKKAFRQKIVDAEGNAATVTTEGRLKVDTNLDNVVINANELNIEDVTINDVGTTEDSLKVKQTGDVSAKSQTQYSASTSNVQYWLGLEEDGQLTKVNNGTATSTKQIFHLALPSTAVGGTCLQRVNHINSGVITGHQDILGTWTQAMQDIVAPPLTSVSFTDDSNAATTVEDQAVDQPIKGVGDAHLGVLKSVGHHGDVTWSITDYDGLDNTIRIDSTTGNTLEVGPNTIGSNAQGAYTVKIKGIDALGGYKISDFTITVSTNDILTLTFDDDSNAANVNYGAANETVIGTIISTGGVGNKIYSITNLGGMTNIKLKSTSYGADNQKLIAGPSTMDSSYGLSTIEVTVTDSLGSGSQTKVANFGITVINTSPTNVALGSPASVFDNSASGYTIGLLTATGGVGASSFTIVDADGLDNIEIVGTTLKVATGGIIDAVGNYAVDIKAKDTVDQEFTKEIIIPVSASFFNKKAIDLRATGASSDHQKNYLQETTGLYNTHMKNDGSFTHSSWLKTNEDPATTTTPERNTVYLRNDGTGTAASNYSHFPIKGTGSGSTRLIGSDKNWTISWWEKYDNQTFGNPLFWHGIGTIASTDKQDGLYIYGNRVYRYTGGSGKGDYPGLRNNASSTAGVVQNFWTEGSPLRTAEYSTESGNLVPPAFGPNQSNKAVVRPAYDGQWHHYVFTFKAPENPGYTDGTGDYWWIVRADHPLVNGEIAPGLVVYVDGYPCYANNSNTSEAALANSVETLLWDTNQRDINFGYKWTGGYDDTTTQQEYMRARKFMQFAIFNDYMTDTNVAELYGASSVGALDGKPQQEHALELTGHSTNPCVGFWDFEELVQGHRNLGTGYPSQLGAVHDPDDNYSPTGATSWHVHYTFYNKADPLGTDYEFKLYTQYNAATGAGGTNTAGRLEASLPRIIDNKDDYQTYIPATQTTTSAPVLLRNGGKTQSSGNTKYLDSANAVNTSDGITFSGVQHTYFAKDKDWSLSFWFKSSAVITGETVGFFNLHLDTLNTSTGPYMYVASNYMYIRWYEGSGGGWKNFPITNVGTGNDKLFNWDSGWNHVVITYAKMIADYPASGQSFYYFGGASNGDSKRRGVSTPGFTIFCNGINVIGAGGSNIAIDTLGTISTATVNWNGNTTSGGHIGYNVGTSDNQQISYDNISVWDKTLSKHEVKELHNADVAYDVVNTGHDDYINTANTFYASYLGTPTDLSTRYDFEHCKLWLNFESESTGALADTTALANSGSDSSAGGVIILEDAGNQNLSISATSTSAKAYVAPVYKIADGMTVSLSDKYSPEIGMTKYLYGRFGSAYNNSGIDSMLHVANVFQDKAYFANDANWSISIWFKDIDLGEGNLYHVGRRGDTGLEVKYTATTINVKINMSGSDPETSVTSLTPVSDNLWHNVTVTYNPNSDSTTIGTSSNANCKIYYDGALGTANDSSTYTGDFESSGTGSVDNLAYLGSDKNGNADGAFGLVHFSTWSRTLTLSEVSSILGANGKPKDLTGKTGLQCWLPLGNGYNLSDPTQVDEGFATTSKFWDMSGNGSHGVPITGQDHDSPTNIGWDISNSPQFGVNDLATSDAIYRAGTLASGDYVKEGSETPSLVISMDGYEDDATKVLSYNKDFTDNNWYNLQLTYDSSATDNKDRLSVFSDSVELTPSNDTTVTFSGNNNYFKNVSDTAVSTTIGATGFLETDAINKHAFQGLFDSISLHSEKFTQAFVNDIYNSGVPTKMTDSEVITTNKIEQWVNFDHASDSGTVAQDETTNNKDLSLYCMEAADYIDLTPFDSIYYNIGSYDNIKYLNQAGQATDSYIKIDGICTTATEIIAVTKDWTVSMWCKTTDTYGDLWTTGGGGEIQFFHYASKLYFQTSSPFVDGYFGGSTSPLLDNEWHHVVVTFKGVAVSGNTWNFDAHATSETTKGLSVYVDGSRLSVDAATTSTNDFENDFDFAWFNRIGAPLQTTAGDFDNLAIFNEHKTALQISAMYNSGTPTNLISDSSLKSWVIFGNLPTGDISTGTVISTTPSETYKATVVNSNSADYTVTEF